MVLDLAQVLPDLLPKAIAWAVAQERDALAKGRPLSEAGYSLAREVGVQHPEYIRVLVVEALPRPEDSLLRQAADQTGLLGPGMTGLTLGYAVFVCRGHEASPTLLRHEFRHVCQYETAGSIRDFLPVYLAQIVQFGYRDAPFERDARAHET